jgi:DNA modification methylase
MANLPESCVDLIVTSPPYNVGIDYDSYNDRQSMEDYWQFTKDWLSESYRILKDDGCIVLVEHDVWSDETHFNHWDHQNGHWMGHYNFETQKYDSINEANIFALAENATTLLAVSLALANIVAIVDWVA